jgi:hypothetical protein
MESKIKGKTISQESHSKRKLYFLLNHFMMIIKSGILYQNLIQELHVNDR